MFKRVVTHKNFLKSAVILGAVYGVVLFLLQWALRSFYAPFLNTTNVLYSLLAGCVAGFFISYGKFWGKLKKQDYKK